MTRSKPNQSGVCLAVLSVFIGSPAAVIKRRISVVKSLLSGRKLFAASLFSARRMIKDANNRAAD